MKKIVVSPHIDDETLGCGGILDEDTFIVECGVDENREVPGWGVVNRKSRLDEIEQVCEMTGAQYSCLSNKVNFYDLHEIVGDLEKVIADMQPDEIYLPHPSYNQDHRQVYEAALTALRPHDVNYMVPRVLVYEQPHVFLWDWNYSNFIPQYYVEIDIDVKIMIYEEALASQVRNFRSSEMLRSLALLRGKQSGKEYAEAFQILRWIK